MLRINGIPRPMSEAVSIEISNTVFWECIYLNICINIKIRISSHTLRYFRPSVLCLEWIPWWDCQKYIFLSSCIYHRPWQMIPKVTQSVPKPHVILFHMADGGSSLMPWHIIPLSCCVLTKGLVCHGQSGKKKVRGIRYSQSRICSWLCLLQSEQWYRVATHGELLFVHPCTHSF